MQKRLFNKKLMMDFQKKSNLWNNKILEIEANSHGEKKSCKEIINEMKNIYL